MPQDILLDNALDLRIENGDFVIGESTMQHQQLLIASHKSDFRGFPLVGVGINDYLLEETEQDLMREIRSQFETDGMKVKRLAFEANKLTVNANYNY
ncbi:MAG: hypothetical protein RL135_1535 [Bacteroidota bacterium]|jgi:hypothetical protein